MAASGGSNFTTNEAAIIRNSLAKVDHARK